MTPNKKRTNQKRNQANTHPNIQSNKLTIIANISETLTPDYSHYNTERQTYSEGC